MEPKIDWIIHLVMNGAVCEHCGRVTDEFVPYSCNAHTHGMEKYDHMDFQLVLKLPVEEIARILNTMGLRVQRGERFKAGDMVSGIYADCEVRLDEFEECDRKVLRVVIPDKHNRFPEEHGCMDIYQLQSWETDDLCIEGEDCTCG